MDKTFTISVDVEDFFPNRDNSDSYFGKIDGKYWGITKIMDICESFGYKVTFFVDVDNTENFVEEEVIKLACKLISLRGHEVALHTHPPLRPDSNLEKDRLMSNYDSDYQYQYILKCAKKIEKWTGKWPKSHRAGSYGANKATFEALSKANILVDSSIFWDRRDFSFTSERPNIHPFKFKHIIEVPVTSYYLNLQTHFPYFNFKINKKTDIEWSSVSEFKQFINQISPLHVDIFMHSYSLINVKKWEPNIYAIQNLVNFLKVVEGKYRNVLFQDFLNEKQYSPLTKSEISMSLSDMSIKDYMNIYLSKFNFKNLSSILGL